MDKVMHNGRSLLVLSVLLGCFLSAYAFGGLGLGARSSGMGRQRDTRYAIYDTVVAELFYEIASEIANSQTLTAPQAEQAIVFLTAAKQLGSTTKQIQALLIKLACEHSNQDYSQQMHLWLQDYVDEGSPTGEGRSIDLEVAKKAITYLLDRLNSREEREALLQDLLATLGGKNAALDSELATLLGLLMVEKADFKAAQFYLLQAYFNNKYNKLAFAKLAELAPDQVGPTMYLEHPRLALRENPMDIEAAMSFARYAEQLQLYEVAATAYQYCADLFGYLYPGEALPPRIYLPWIISNYNTEQNQHRCLQIAERVRKSGRFDILVEAIAGKAAAKIGNTAEASRIFQATESKAQQLLGGKFEIPAGEGFGAKQFAWFYCFAVRDAAKALDWANKAYSTDPNSPVAAALLSYALVMNQQLEWARPLIENYEHNQIADLVQAHIELADGQKDLAIETLKSAIAKDPGSLAAERAKEILAQQGGEYIPPVDCDFVLTMLRNDFGRSIIPEFASGDKIISVRFNTGGNEFSYGSKFNGTVAIINNSSEPLVISDDGLFKGYIRIDANISGDLTKKIPKLVSRRIGSALLIEPGKSILISVRLVTGELRRILLSYPQASLDIEFTLYLDPVESRQGEIISRILDLRPVKMVVKRPGVELTSSYLRNRFNSISTGQTSQKIHVAKLFVGLLKEQHAMAKHGTLYRYKYADWMPNFLNSALQELITENSKLKTGDEQWPIKVHTMAEMLSLPLNPELMNAVAKNLNHPKWPVRLMAVYLLAKTADGEFSKVLDWISKHDSSKFVRDMAITLGAAETQALEPLRPGRSPSSEPQELSLLRLE